jgi:hypothetical protein
MKFSYISSTQFTGSYLTTYDNGSYYIPYTQRPTTLSFWLKQVNYQVDSLAVSIEINNQVKLGYGYKVIMAKDTNFNKYSVNITYSSTSQPTIMRIIFDPLSSINPSSYFIVDDISTELDVGIQDVNNEGEINISRLSNANEIMINSKWGSVESVEIIDILGKSVYNKLYRPLMDISELGKGIFVIRVHLANGKELLKKVVF